MKIVSILIALAAGVALGLLLANADSKPESFADRFECIVSFSADINSSSAPFIAQYCSRFD